ncbi:hypothetical protein KI811_01215 [Geobacter hydrogenophilus]|uniref:Uncharacterized protein n=1 Tax=Geobacter hydrogenophilus TaxID=40983 RepID=A0A9W6G3P9_9BACT|nr:hypothetical protein [Geobacter hydrogenophilus]MBT0892438.1 hypothetical protein [Geobacter hydrogenophilus]GLI39835.1 hypothetical protein GHYDROH2_33360 [Geobacter hydrogenophilus]
MSVEIILAGIVGFLTGSVVTFFAFKSKTKETRNDSLSVITYPYKEVHGENGWFSDDRSAVVGYKFQLLVNGIPCFEPHKIPVETFSKKEVNTERIEQASNQVVNMIEKIASMHPAIAALKSVPELTDKAMKIVSKANN